MNSPLYENIDSNDIESRKEYSRMYQPNFTRSRQIYRGPRDSEKTNLEIQQLAYDLALANTQLNQIHAINRDFVSVLEEGLDYSEAYIWADFSEPVSKYSSDDDTVSEQELDPFYDTVAAIYRTLESQKRIVGSIAQYLMEN